MRLVRIAKLTALLTALIAISIGGPVLFNWIAAELQRRSELPNPILASSEESREIVSVVLDRMEYIGLPPPPPENGEPPAAVPKRTLILSDKSICFLHSPQDRGCQSGPTDSLSGTELDALSPKKLREELAMANQSSHSLQLSNIRGAKIVSSSELERIFSGGWWREFYRLFPGTSGYARVSRPVLTEDRKRALIYIDHRCDGTCGTGTILLLERSGSGWRVLREEMLWIS